MSRQFLTGFAAGACFPMAFAIMSCSADTRTAGQPASPISQVAEDEARQYWIARRNVIHGDAHDALWHAKQAAAAYLQAGDEANYRKWVLISKELPATEEGVSAPPVERTDTMGQLQHLMREHRNDSQHDYAPPAQRAEPQKTYTYEEKQKMRADFLKSQEDAAQKKIEDDSEVIANKLQRKREAQKAAEQKERLKVALESSPLRPWKTLGGKDASRARIVGYSEDSITLEKWDGNRIELKESRLSPADKTYVEEWKTRAGL